MITKTTSQMLELSVVIVVVSNAKHLEGCLQALSEQVAAPAMEIIVPYYGHCDISTLKPRFPKVQFCLVADLGSGTESLRPSHEYLDKMRAIGLERAQGRIVALLEDHDRPDKYWAKHTVEVHREPYAAVGGAIENEVDRPLNWAVYFCDFGRYQNPLKSGPSPYLSDVNISYKRQSLNNIKDLWLGFYHEPFVNGALRARGETLWLSPSIVVYQHREDLSLRNALRERYDWGRYYAGFRTQEFTNSKRLFFLILSPVLPFVLITRKIRDVLIRKRLIGAFMMAFPLTFLLTLFWSLGEFVGYWTARPTAYSRFSDQDLPKHA